MTNPLALLLVPYESETLHGHEFFFRYISDAEQTELAEFIHGLPTPDDDDRTTQAAQAKAIARQCIVKSVRLHEKTAENAKPDLTDDQANILLLKMGKLEQQGVTRTKLAEMAMEACGWGRVSVDELEEAREAAEADDESSDEAKEAEDPLASGESSERFSTT
ncbi:MAG: hypothetical protein OXF62_17830 [Caldilineaceae bacterium]|nr:hypothetical protein [Caldilineaceae bacterium]